MCVTALFAIRAWVGLITLEFGDETEKYVAAAMIRHGGRLYADIFDNHGPLAYLLAWLVTFVTGLEDFTRARLVVVAFALLATASVALCPAARRPAWGAALFLAPVSALWFVHPLHMLIYHALGGYLLTVVLAQWTLAGLLAGAIGRWGAVVSGACAVLAVAAAYPFAVPAGLLVAAGAFGLAGHAGWMAVLPALPWFAAGALAAALPLAVWISVHADWVGLYVYHFHFNQTIYSRMTLFSLSDVWHGLDLSFGPVGRPHAFAVITGAAGLLGVVWLLRGRMPLPRLAARGAAVGSLALGMMMLNPRGMTEFPDTAQMIGCFGLFAVVLAVALGETRPVRLWSAVAAAFVFIAGAEGVARSSRISPHGMWRAEAPVSLLRPNPDDDLVREIWRVTPPGGTILVLPFMPAVYIHAARLPASGYYYALPYQAEYDKAPILGRRIDLCGDIERAKPQALVIGEQPFPVWGSVLNYTPCLAGVLARHYVRSKGVEFLYVRRDAATR